MDITEIIEVVVYEEPSGWRRLAGGAREFLAAVGTPTGRLSLAFVAALALAEAVTALFEARAGMALHGLLLVALILYSSIKARGAQQRFLMVLTLAPLIRVLSLAMPLPNFPLVYWYMIVGAPLFLAATLAARLAKLNRGMLGLTRQALPAQLLIGLTGAGLGYLEYMILRPNPLAPALRLELIWLPALILLIFTGLLEEFIFRGVMQYAAVVNLGRYGLLFVPVVFAVLHLGYRSALDVLFVFAVALFFGWAVQRTGSILGVTLAHGLTNVGLFLIFPFLLAPKAAPEAVIPITAPPDILAPAAAVTPISPAVPALLPTAVVPASLTPTALPPTATASVTPAPTGTPTELPPTETATEAAQPTATSCGAPPGWTVYIVRPGDRLSSLSLALGVSLAQLQQANCLANPNRIYAGQALWVPYLPPALYPTLPPTAVPWPTATPWPTAALPTAAPTEIPTQPPPPTAAPTEPAPTAAPPTEAPPTEAPPPPPPTEPAPPPPTDAPPLEPSPAPPTPAP